MGVLGWLVAALSLVLWTAGTVAVTRAELYRREIRRQAFARRVALVGTVPGERPANPPGGRAHDPAATRAVHPAAR